MLGPPIARASSKRFIDGTLLGGGLAEPVARVNGDGEELPISMALPIFQAVRHQKQGLAPKHPTPSGARRSKWGMAMEQTHEASETELTNGAIQRLIDGEDPLSLKTSLENQLDPELASRIFETAFSKFHAAQDSETLLELQHSIYFAKRPSVAHRAAAGRNVLILGVSATAVSYFFAPPGATFTIFASVIAYGAWLLISS